MMAGMEKRGLLLPAVVAVLFAVALGVTAGAQEPELELPPQTSTGLPINFSPPGARALGMGGAFIAIADDATASEANPAGLTILTRPEVSAHLTRASHTLAYEDPNTDFFAQFDPVAGEAAPSFECSSTRFSFASWVYPFDSVSLSIYYREAALFDAQDEVVATNEPYQDWFVSGRSMGYSLRHFGVAAGYRLGDMVSIGASLRDTHLDILAVSRLRGDYLTDLELITGNLDHTDFVEVRQTIDGLDTDLTFNLGLLLNPNGKISAGLVYSEGGDFSYAGEVTYLECVNAPELGYTCDLESGEGSHLEMLFGSEPVELSLPDVWGLGVAWRPSRELTVAADLRRVEYGSLYDPATDSERVGSELEVHLGVEYAFLSQSGGMPFSLRAGAYSDPDHDGSAEVDSEQTHFTVGTGVVLDERVQLDLAAHFAETIDEYVLSLVYWF